METANFVSGLYAHVGRYKNGCRVSWYTPIVGVVSTIHTVTDENVFIVRFEVKAQLLKRKSNPSGTIGTSMPRMPLY
jgi:hypothetical protein